MDTKEVDLLSIDIAYLGPTSLYSEGRDVYEPIWSTIPRDVYWGCSSTSNDNTLVHARAYSVFPTLSIGVNLHTRRKTLYELAPLMYCYNAVSTVLRWSKHEEGICTFGSVHYRKSELDEIYAWVYYDNRKQTDYS